MRRRKKCNRNDGSLRVYPRLLLPLFTRRRSEASEKLDLATTNMPDTVTRRSESLDRARLSHGHIKASSPIALRLHEPVERCNPPFLTVIGLPGESSSRRRGSRIKSTPRGVGKVFSS
jgi:hypothetical protein